MTVPFPKMLKSAPEIFCLCEKKFQSGMRRCCKIPVCDKGHACLMISADLFFSFLTEKVSI
jgi:hypothetical protein